MAICLCLSKSPKTTFGKLDSNVKVFYYQLIWLFIERRPNIPLRATVAGRGWEPWNGPSSSKKTWKALLTVRRAAVQDPAAVWRFGRPLQGVQRPQNSPGGLDGEVLCYRNFHWWHESRPSQRRPQHQRQPWRCSETGSSLRPQTEREEVGKEEGHHLFLTSQWCVCFILIVFCFFSSIQQPSAASVNLKTLVKPV